MASIVPTITAYDEYEYNEQLKALKPFASRIHIDLMDGEFAPSRSPDLSHIWWPHEMTADIHIMYQNPMDYIDQLIALKPRLVIIHNEANVHHMDFAARLHAAGIEAGLALLHDTPVEWAHQIMHSFDHVLIFSGNLGFQGGTADLGCLDKVVKVKAHHPDAEIGWDGGINRLNAPLLIDGGVDVLNVGSYIKNSQNPAATYAELISLQ